MEQLLHQNRWQYITALGKNLVLAIGLLALLEISKTSLSTLANVELVSLLLIVYTLTYGRDVMFILPGFLVIEARLYGFGTWLIMYAYVWLVLIVLSYVFRQRKSVFFWAALSGLFGLCFGGLCTLPYIFTLGWHEAFLWWTAGLSFDVIHAAGNFVLCLLLFKPLMKVFGKLKEKTFPNHKPQ